MHNSLDENIKDFKQNPQNKNYNTNYDVICIESPKSVRYDYIGAKFRGNELSNEISTSVYSIIPDIDNDLSYNSNGHFTPEWIVKAFADVRCSVFIAREGKGR